MFSAGKLSAQTSPMFGVSELFRKAAEVRALAQSMSYTSAACLDIPVTMSERNDRAIAKIVKTPTAKTSTLR